MAFDNGFNEYGLEIGDLRVFRVLEPGQQHRTTDFSILGFRKTSPKYERGKKVRSEYVFKGTDELIICKKFYDIRDVTTNRLTALKIRFEWYDENNEVGDFKEEIVKEYNEWEAQTEERKRRERQIDFLIAEGTRANAAAYLDMLFNYFKLEIDQYLASGSNNWENAVNSHLPKFIGDDPANGADQTQIETQIYGILIARPEGVLSIKEAILYQLTGVLPVVEE